MANQEGLPIAEAFAQAEAMKQEIKRGNAAGYGEAARLVELQRANDAFLVPRESDYRNPAFMRLEQDYLLSPDYNQEHFSEHQYRYKVSVLALRLGREFREKNPDPTRRNPELGVQRFRDIVGPEAESRRLTLYEDDPDRPFHADLTPEFQNLDITALKDNAVQLIERQGRGLKRRTERKIIEEGQLPTDDNGRIREITLRRSDGTEVRAVCKRVDLKRVSQEPFEEAQVLEVANSEQLPSQQLIGRVEARGNRYILWRKIEGMTLRKLTPEVLRTKLGRQNPDEDLRVIREEVERIKSLYAKSRIHREDWDDKDMLVSYDERQDSFIVTPMDFEKSRLRNDPDNTAPTE